MTNSIPYRTVSSKKRINLYEFSVYIAVFASFLIFIGNPYQIDALVSLGTKLLIIANAFCGLLYIANNLKQKRLNRLVVLVVLIIVTSLLAYVASGISSIYSSLVALLGFWAIPFYFLYYKDVSNRARLKSSVYKIYILLSLFYIYLSFTSLSNIGYSEWGNYESHLSLGYGNPNETGMYLLICFVVILSASAFCEKKLVKIFLWVDAAYLFYLIIGTNSVACYLVAIFVFLMTISKLAEKLKDWQIELIMLASFIFIFLNVVYSVWLSKIVILGSSAESGRNIFYENYFANLNTINFLFGDFQSFGLGNIHNGYLSILASLGVFGFLPFYLFLRKSLLWVKKQCIGLKSEQIAFLGLLGVVLQSSAEAAFLVSGVVFASSVGILYLLALPDLKGGFITGVKHKKTIPK